MAPSQNRDNHAALHASFRWQVPQRFNIAQACCTRWARSPGASRRIAVRAHSERGVPAVLSYSELQAQADAVSRALRALGVQRGDRVAIVMPQRFETAVAYMAVFQLGAVAMPLSMLFGPEALEFRLCDSGAVVAICDDSSMANIAQVRERCPALRTVAGVGAAAAQCDADWLDWMRDRSGAFDPVDTAADEAAVLIYTSGTTGPPKGALIPHRALIGNLPGFVCSQNWFGFDPARGGDSQAVFWSPADWAWTGGLMDALLPSLYFGRPIVAFNGRFSPELAFTLMQQHGVTHTFLFPTALKAMMKAFPRPRERFPLRLQAVMSAGEAVGDAVFAYCREQLGVTVNEMFGQTEINYVVGNCSMEWAPTLPASRGSLPPEGAQPALGRPGGGLTAGRAVVGWPARPGSMGRPYPGHRVAVIDDAGNECPPGEPGDVAVHRCDVHGDLDPIFFLGYWNQEDATRRKFTGDWCRTGDLAVRDEDGYLWYQGRADDVFKAAGYRIGPGEIENCLVKHPAVANAAVVPKPDRERGAVVKAYVVLAPGHAGGDSLVAELQQHVKGKLAPYEYPKEIEFIEQLPMTTTGKVQRRVLRLQEEERARAQAAQP
ncbi:acyl-CoA synthetase [Ramlibacter tataouinensis]|uniref:Acetyl-CoA synthase (Acetate thiokinase) n=1 Tax=Ramlibacter tataouinensis (strain ATCC BAA-407 / DSM 14655 / LMG 21543 / TTB310) TaxID=365046 RepID=F5Y0A6_RAMTT|nr:AMP-binding protein [Ramlibacter tataouinensis]AEG92128.1 Acetyl-CoA synthase (Acetate thiokinase) [Ramlibacter tataouinensis TTB310]